MTSEPISPAIGSRKITSSSTVTVAAMPRRPAKTLTIGWKTRSAYNPSQIQSTIQGANGARITTEPRHNRARSQRGIGSRVTLASYHPYLHADM